MQRNKVDDEAILNRGIAKVNCGEYKKAIILFESLIASHTVSFTLYYYLGIAQLKLSAFQKAAGYFEKSIEIEPTENAYIKLAFALGELKDFEKSIEILKEALEIFPKSADLYSYLGVALRSMNRSFEAIESFWFALKEDSEHLGANWGLGVSYGIIGDRERSIKFLKQAVDIKPSFAPPHFHLAMNHISLADYVSAEKELKILEEVDPVYADFLRNELEKFKEVYK